MIKFPRPILFVGLLLSVSCFLFPAAAKAAGAAELSGYKLHQSLRIGGDVDLYVCPTALRVCFVKSRLNFVTRAPWKEAYLYCQDTGQIFRTPFSKVVSPYQQAMALFDGAITTQVKVLPRKSEKLLGVNCRICEDPPGQAQKLTELFKKGDITGRAPGKLRFVMTDSLKVPPQLASALSRFYALPDSSGVPLEFSFTTVGGDKMHELRTFKISPEKFLNADFDPPTGLKWVKDGRLVLVPAGQGEENGIDLMMLNRSGFK